MQVDYDNRATFVTRNEVIRIANDAMQLALTQLKLGDESMYLKSCTSTLDTIAFNSIMGLGQTKDRNKCKRKGVAAVKAYLRNRPDFLELRPKVCTKKTAPYRDPSGVVFATRT